MGDVTWRRYYWEWLRRAFKRPLVVGQAVSFLLALVAGYAVRERPELGGQFTFMLWAIPLAVFLAILVWGFALAPITFTGNLRTSATAFEPRWTV